MVRDRSEWNDITDKSAVADLTGRRLGRVTAVLGKGLFRIGWEDGEAEVLPRHALLVRYTTSSVDFYKKTPTRA